MPIVPPRGAARRTASAFGAAFAAIGSWSAILGAGSTAYDDNYGPEDTMRYGHGRTEDEAIAECLDVLADYEEAKKEAA